MWFQTVNSQWTTATTNSETAQGPIGLWEPGYRTTKFTSLLNIYLVIYLYFTCHYFKYYSSNRWCSYINVTMQDNKGVIWTVFLPTLSHFPAFYSTLNHTAFLILLRQPRHHHHPQKMIAQCRIIPAPRGLSQSIIQHCQLMARFVYVMIYWILLFFSSSSTDKFIEFLTNGLTGPRGSKLTYNFFSFFLKKNPQKNKKLR